MADIGSKGVDGQHHPLLLAQEGMQSLAISRGQSPQFVVAIQEVANGAEGNGDAAAREFLVDLGNAAMLGMTEASDQGEQVEPKLVVGQSEERLRFGAMWAMEACAVGVGAASDMQSEACDGVEGGDGAVVGVGGTQAMAALWAMVKDRDQSLPRASDADDVGFVPCCQFS